MPEPVDLNTLNGPRFVGEIAPESFGQLVDRALAVLNRFTLSKSKANADYSEILEALQRDLSQAVFVSDIGPVDTEFSLSPQEVSWMERHPEQEWAPYLIHRYKFKVDSMKQKLRAFPPHLLIEPTSVCNIRCVMCFQIDESFGASREFMGMMPWDLFTSVVDQAVEHDCHAITLASRGEPTIHREFPQMLEYLHEKGVLDTKINTNATRLTEELSHQILRAEVSTVTFSVDAADKETYERIRVGGKFDEVLANIDNFNRIRDSDYPDSATTTRISGVAVENTQDPNEMQAFWSHRVDHVAIVPMNPRWDTYNNPLFNRTKSCGYLYERMYVWWDGTCNPCDFDYKSLLAVGDAKEDSLESIWKGPKFQRIRELHDQKLRSSLNPCDRCPL